LARGNRSQPPSERTEEERERDRRERARRRTGQVAKAPQDAPATTPVKPADAASNDARVVEVLPRPPEQSVEAPEQPTVVETVPPMPTPVEESAEPALPPIPAPAPIPSPDRRDALLEQRRHRLRTHRGERHGGPFKLTGARLGALLILIAVVALGALVLARALRSGGTRPRPLATVEIVKVLIPEGETRLQIAELAKADGLTGSYRKAAKRSPLLNPATYGAPRGTPDLEGFLFPATYDMVVGAPVSRLVAEQLTAFQERFGPEEVRRARELHVTPYQLLTVASMVEREAQLPGDRPKIAAVIYNRLRLGMPLGIDATIYYAVEQAEGIATYTHELTASQLRIDSPYNTRTHRGLPPTPISNPGMASIEAAAHPAHVPYLYYVAGADGCGEQVFSTSYAQFEADAAAYDAAVKKNGGKPPVCKKK
jgi:cell division protein YceG involved in septum cleavage